MTTTRQKILDYLKRNQTSSSREVARVLRMTPANARHHLGILAADGRVELVSQRQGGRGRPEKVYRLSGTLAGNNLSALADALLREFGEEIDLDAIAVRLADGKIEVDQPLMRRLTSAVEHLNNMHYQARWEAGADGPRIVLGHCPYVGLVREHPKLCAMDEAFLAVKLGMGLEQTAKLELGAGERPFCAFVVSS